MAKNITAISASGGNPHDDMSGLFLPACSSLFIPGEHFQAFVTFFLESSKCLAIAGSERKEVYPG